jgi:hypothetical protein
MYSLIFWSLSFERSYGEVREYIKTIYLSPSSSISSISLHLLCKKILCRAKEHSRPFLCVYFKSKTASQRKVRDHRKKSSQVTDVTFCLFLLKKMIDPLYKSLFMCNALSYQGFWKHSIFNWKMPFLSIIINRILVRLGII